MVKIAFIYLQTKFINCVLMIFVFIYVPCRSFERTTPIWFNKCVNQDDEEAGDFLEARRDIFSLATTHSIINIINMSQYINNDNLANHIGFFKEQLHGVTLPSRLPEIYSVYRLFSQEVRMQVFLKNI